MDRAVTIQAGFLLNRCCFLTSRGGVEGGGALEGFQLALTLRPEALLIIFIHSFSKYVRAMTCHGEPLG